MKQTKQDFERNTISQEERERLLRLQAAHYGKPYPSRAHGGNHGLSEEELNALQANLKVALGPSSDVCLKKLFDAVAVKFTSRQWTEICVAIRDFRLGYLAAQYGEPLSSTQLGNLSDVVTRAKALLVAYKALGEPLQYRTLNRLRMEKLRKQDKAGGRTLSLTMFAFTEEAANWKAFPNMLDALAKAAEYELKNAKKTTGGRDKSSRGREALVRKLQGIHKEAVGPMKGLKPAFEKLYFALRDVMPADLQADLPDNSDSLKQMIKRAAR